MSGGTVTVVLVDDHTMLRQGLRRALEAEGLTVLAEAGDGAAAVQTVLEHRPDVVLMDVSMPGMDGLTAVKLLKEANPGLAVLILSMYPEEQYAVRCLRAGAAGYLTKESAGAELLTAIRKVAAGGRYVTQSLAERLVMALAGDGQAPHEALSDREYQVLRLITAGRTVGEIAAELSLSVKTVSTYRTRILEKLGLHTTAELVRYGVQNGLE